MAGSFGPIAVKVLLEARQRCLPIRLVVVARLWVLFFSQVVCCEDGSCGAVRAGGGGAGAVGEVSGPAEREQTPVLQTNNGPSLIGFITIAAHLVKQAKKEQLLGSTAEEKAVVQQWLEYRVTRVDGCSSKEDTRIILKIDAQSFFKRSRWKQKRKPQGSLSYLSSQMAGSRLKKTYSIFLLTPYD
ncbi:eukaryotic translation elongation factor 1 epsilon-1 isoform X2 [Dromaius novaehollandiae]|uniref:eukaryotic translation elongation factor 1 epsilon-1 isoform X2 n=1 Tax=Dromaius novaehollandiae TaxID=8790 RepID=UPI0031201440